jgi:hypothetical protein
MANNEKQNLLGRPYVLWNSRPAKNGQPPPCYGQCNINIGTRKVGAALRRLPELQYGMKAKEQILQKWDPVSRSLVNIHVRDPTGPPQAISDVVLTISYPAYDSDISDYASNYTVSFNTTLQDTNEAIQYSVFYVGTPDISIFSQQVYSISRVGSIQTTTGYSGKSFYAVLTYGGKTFRSPNVDVPLIEITNFSGEQSELNPVVYGYSIDFVTTLDALISGTYTLYQNDDPSTEGDGVLPIGTPLTIYANSENTGNILSDVSLVSYLFGQISIGGKIFKSNTLQPVLPSITINDFYINPVGDEGIGDIGLSFLFVEFNNIYTGNAIFYDHGTSGVFQATPTEVAREEINTGLEDIIISNQSLIIGHYYSATIEIGLITQSVTELLYFEITPP